MKTNRVLLCASLSLAVLMLSSAAWASALPSNASPTDPWQPLTPPPGGTMRALAASPHFMTDRALFAGTDGALSRSTDAGLTWTELGPGPYGPIVAVRQIVLSPQYPVDPTIFLWACPYGPGGYGCSLLRSMDNGDVWHAIWDVEHPVADIAVSPGYATDHTLFVATVTPEGGELRRSTDRGDTWQVVHEFGDSLYWFRIGLSPNFTVDSTLFAIGFGAMQRSTDGGVTWETLSAPNPNYNLAISPNFATDHTLWAMYREIEGSGQRPENGIVWSEDTGDTWTVAAGLPADYSTYYEDLTVDPTGQSVYVSLLASGPVNPLVSQVYRSDNGGQSWAPQSLLPDNGPTFAIEAPGPFPALYTISGVARQPFVYASRCYQTLADGGIETDPPREGYGADVARAWDIPDTALMAGYADDYRHDGAWSMRTGADADGPNVYSYSSFRQRVSIPADTGSATLTFWRYPILGDTSAVGKNEVNVTDLLSAGPEVADYQYLLALHDDGSYDVLRIWRDNSQTWTETTVDLSAYAGRSIRLHFGTFNNGTGNPSGMFVDSAALEVCLQSEQTGTRFYLPLILRDSAPPPTVAPTPSATGTPTVTATPSPTLHPSVTASFTPTPTAAPSAIPTATPGFVPTPYWAGRLNLPAGSRPHGVALNAAGNRAYIAFHGVDHSGHTLGVVNEYLSLQAQIDLGAGATGPNGVAVIPASGQVVVTNRQTGNASVVDPAAGAVMATIPAGSMPDGVVIQGGYGYIANFGSDSVTVFDAHTLAVAATLTNVGHEPAMLAAGDPASDEVFLTAHGSNQVFHLRGTSVLGHWDGVAAPYGISYDPASRRLYVANRGPAHTVTVIDVYLDQVVGTIAVGKEPYVLLVNPESGHLFVACDDEVKVYDTYDWSPVTSIPVPPGATEGIAFEPRLSKVFVTSTASDALTVIQDQGPARVLFSSDRDGNGDIYRMLPDGRNVQRLTTTADAWEAAATGSPDGRWIAYVRHEAVGPNHIWLMSRDGRGATMLTDGPSDNIDPTWSADSSKLAFASTRDGDWEIYTLDVATRAVTRLTDNAWDDMQPDWSKISGRIAFVSTRFSSNGELFTMAADGSDVQQLTSNVNGDGQPSWSPSANRLAFFGTRPAGQALYTVRSDGSDVQLLAPQSLRPNSPAWGFVGDTILFTGFRPGSGYSEIMRIEADASGLALLTNNEVNFDYSPGWLPGW